MMPSSSELSELISINPSINASFNDSSIPATVDISRFETESRELFVERNRLCSELPLIEGQTVVDLGAGSGLFMELVSERLGPNGTLICAEPSAKFCQYMIERLNGLNNTDKRAHIHIIQSLPHTLTHPVIQTHKIDIVYCIDTYHHFEYPIEILKSIRTTLKPNGLFVIVDYERIPGVTSDRLMGHLRCGKEIAMNEVESVGFVLIEEKHILKENYFLIFRSP
ncbi:unnamed protein product [Rotaria sp. Silwood1]|nr:unnamed protein product [Rotaria sp. Silwood1]CAF3595991.1 unnamed protein product [Rotaria sp. Silwood1]CAF4840391.1 unnamed protein product [Rotaria sp. Silwood1]